MALIFDQDLVQHKLRIMTKLVTKGTKGYKGLFN